MFWHPSVCVGVLKYQPSLWKQSGGGVSRAGLRFTIFNRCKRSKSSSDVLFSNISLAGCRPPCCHILVVLWRIYWFGSAMQWYHQKYFKKGKRRVPWEIRLAVLVWPRFFLLVDFYDLFLLSAVVSWRNWAWNWQLF